MDAQVALATQALIDYQSQAPWQLTDSNGVVQQVLYDPRGSVAAQSVCRPKADGPASATRTWPTTWRAEASFDAVIADPAYYLQGAGAFYFYDFQAPSATPPQPASAITLTRSRYASDGVADAHIELTIEFTDGFGQVVEGKRECEAGMAVLRDARARCNATARACRAWA